MNGPQITFFGNLVQDPEVKFSPNSGKQFTTIRVAVNTYRGREKERETQYFNVALWREQWTHMLAQCRKGQQVYISGQYSIFEYTRRDGTKGYSQNVNADDFESFLPRTPAPPVETKEEVQEGGAQQEQTQVAENIQESPDQPAEETQAATTDEQETETSQPGSIESEEEERALERFEEIMESSQDYADNFL